MDNLANLEQLSPTGTVVIVGVLRLWVASGGVGTYFLTTLTNC